VQHVRISEQRTRSQLVGAEDIFELISEAFQIDKGMPRQISGARPYEAKRDKLLLKKQRIKKINSEIDEKLFC
jgi:hypothetical protein